MKLTIDIPQEFEIDFIRDKFKDFFSRVITDIYNNDSGLCGQYEREIAEMFIKAFNEADEQEPKLHNKPSSKLYRKQIRPIAEGAMWQGFKPEKPIPLDNWIDIDDNEQEIENQLKEKWTDEEMFKITHDRMRWLEFEYRFI